jgi:hypothetical protein
VKWAGELSWVSGCTRLLVLLFSWSNAPLASRIRARGGRVELSFLHKRQKVCPPLWLGTYDLRRALRRPKAVPVNEQLFRITSPKSLWTTCYPSRRPRSASSTGKGSTLVLVYPTDITLYHRRRGLVDFVRALQRGRVPRVQRLRADEASEFVRSPQRPGGSGDQATSPELGHWSKGRCRS